MDHPNPWLMRILLIALAVALLAALPVIPGADAVGSVSVEQDADVQASGAGDIPPDAENEVDAVRSEVDGVVQETTEGLPIASEQVTHTTGTVESLVQQNAEAAQTSSATGAADSDRISPIHVAAGSAAVAAGGAGLLFWAKNGLGLVLARLVGLPLFSRLSKDDLLENDGREMLFNLVEANPGIGLAQLADRSGLGWGTTVYHLGRLEQGGFISSMKNGQARHFFKNGHPAAQQKQAVAVLQNDTASQVARFLLTTPGATGKTIASGLGIAAPTVTKYVKRLEEAGLVETLREGRSKIVQPTETLASAMRHIEVPMPELPMQRDVPAQALSAYA